MSEEEQAEYGLWLEAAAASARRPARVPREAAAPVVALPATEPAPA